MELRNTYTDLWQKILKPYILTKRSVPVMIAVTTGAAFCSYLGYNAVQAYMETSRTTLKQQRDLKEEFGSNTVELLAELDRTDLDVDALEYILKTLSSQCAFTAIQNIFRDLGCLNKIVDLMSHPAVKVKIQACILVNNLSANEENQAILKERGIPMLISFIVTSIENPSDLLTTEEEGLTMGLAVAVAQALTNLTTLDDSHPSIVPHLHVVANRLRVTDFQQEKVQLLKILTNVSTNKKLCRHQFDVDVQLLQAVEGMVSVDEHPDVLLRAVTCCANVITAVHQRFQNTNRQYISPAEMVTEALRLNLELVTLTESEEMTEARAKALTCIECLSPTSSHETSAQEPSVHEISLDEISAHDKSFEEASPREMSAHKSSSLDIMDVLRI